MEPIMSNDFQIWMQKLGYHGKQVAEAGRVIGQGHRNNSHKTYTGQRELTDTERLAMAAVRAGLPAWTPETDQEIADMGELRQIIERAAARPARTSRLEPSSGFPALPF